MFIQNLKSIQDSSSAWGVKGSADRIKVDEVGGSSARLLTAHRVTCGQGGLKFSVEHYAGNVIYDANSFVSKNKDVLKPELQSVPQHPPCRCNAICFATALLASHSAQVLDGSSVRMIKSFVQATPGEGVASGNASLTMQFRAQLEKLMQTLGQAPSFVKCIKPRDVIAGEYMGAV